MWQIDASSKSCGHKSDTTMMHEYDMATQGAYTFGKMKFREFSRPSK